MAKHYTLSGVISTDSIQQFSEQQSSFTKETKGTGFLSISVDNSYVLGSAPIDSSSYSRIFTDDGNQNSVSSSGQTQGNTFTEEAKRTGKAGDSYSLVTTRTNKGTTVAEGNSFSNTSSSSKSGDHSNTVSASGSTMETKMTRSTKDSSTGSYSFSGSIETNSGSNSASGSGATTLQGTTTDYSSGKTIGSGYTLTTGRSYTFTQNGGGEAANGATGVSLYNYPGLTNETTSSSTSYSNDASQTGSHNTSGSTSGTRQTFSTDTTQVSTEYKTSTFSESIKFSETTTMSDFVFSNDDTTITVSKTTLAFTTEEDGDTTISSRTTTQKDQTKDTISSETIETSFDLTADTFPTNAASTFTIFGNAGFITTDATGFIDMRMTGMAQSVTTPGAIKPGNDEFIASAQGQSVYTYELSRTLSSRTDGSTNTISFESRSAKYFRDTVESFTTTGEESIDYSTRLISTTTESYFETTFVSTKTRGTEYYTTTTSQYGTFQLVDSYITSTYEKTFPIIYFDGTTFGSTEDTFTVRISTTGPTQRAFSLGVFGGSEAKFFMTSHKSFVKPGADDTAMKIFNAYAEPRVFSAVEDFFHGERAFVQETTGGSEALFSKDFPPILESSTTLSTTTDNDQTTSTSTTGTFTTALGSIRNRVFLMLTDSTFKIKDFFTQNGSTGKVRKTNFTISEPGQNTDVNYIENSDEIRRSTGVLFTGGINNVTSDGTLTVEGIGSFKIGSETFSVGSLETFSTNIPFGTMVKIQNEPKLFATHDSNGGNILSGNILISDLNNETNL